MRITVCIKQVPDTGARIRISPDGRGIDAGAVKPVTSPYDEFALEAALQLAGDAGEVSLLSYGGAQAESALRSGLALGAHRATLLKGTPSMDGWATAQTLADWISKEPPDLLLAGVKAVDDDLAAVGPMVAEILEWPCATSVTQLEAKDERIVCARAVEGGFQSVELSLPAVCTITKGRYELRYASLRGIMAAKRKPLAVEAAKEAQAMVRVEKMELPPARGAGRIVGQGAEAAPELARLLREEAKVL